MTVLCVGCGALPEGDVNVDVYPLHHSRRSCTWNRKETLNFTLADSHKLPYRDGEFSEVKARHCLEHMHTPLEALREMRRVCTGKVKVWIPSQWRKDYSPEHLYAWSPIELANLMRKAGLANVKTGYTNHALKYASVKTTLFNFIVKLFGFYSEIYGEGTKW